MLPYWEVYEIALKEGRDLCEYYRLFDVFYGDSRCGSARGVVYGARTPQNW